MNLNFDAKKIGLVTGILLFIIFLLFPAPKGMSLQAWNVAAVTVLMAIWWITEAIPLPATSLLPIFLFPLLGILKTGQTTTNYGDPIIFLFMGGFFLAVSMERWNLHRRIALYTLKLVGTSPSKMIIGFMCATAFLSMWISNTATAVMMVPIGIALVSQIVGITKENIGNNLDKSAVNFSKALMLSIAYSASLGGIATIIGTPPNTIMVGILKKNYGLHISYMRWMVFGFPLAVVMLIITWLILTKVLFRMDGLKLAGSEKLIEEEIKSLGKLSKGEKLVIFVGCLMAFFWVFNGFLAKKILFLSRLTDTNIAIGGSILLFVLPVDYKKNIPILDWKNAVKIPWDIILLFGGGLSLSSAFLATGLAEWISLRMEVLHGMSMVMFVIFVATLTVLLTEVTSNTATATLLVPIMGAAAIAMKIHPFATIISACLSASFAFMLPVATPPNAVVFGSGYIKVKDMAYAGLLINIVGVFVITLFTVYVLPILWGVDLSVGINDTLVP